MERLTRKETIIVEGEEIAACNHENDECNDSCMYGKCKWQEKSNLLLKKYEDTGLTPEEILKLKERDKAKEPEIHKDKFSDTYVCPYCNLVFIHKDGTGWFCGKRYKFCPDCGQRIKWED